MLAPLQFHYWIKSNRFKLTTKLLLSYGLDGFFFLSWIWLHPPRLAITAIEFNLSNEHSFANWVSRFYAHDLFLDWTFVIQTAEQFQTHRFHVIQAAILLLKPIEPTSLAIIKEKWIENRILKKWIPCLFRFRYFHFKYVHNTQSHTHTLKFIHSPIVFSIYCNVIFERFIFRNYLLLFIRFHFCFWQFSAKPTENVNFVDVWGCVQMGCEWWDFILYWVELHT